MPRDKMITVRVTEQELKKAQEKAEKSGRTVGSLIRWLLFHKTLRKV